MVENKEGKDAEKPEVKHSPVFLLVDGYSLLFRAYYSMGPMNGPDGTPTGALFGLALMLIRAIEDMKPDYLLVAFDAKGKTFRHEEFPAYKAQRGETPEDLIAQLQLSRELVKVLGMDFEELVGFEADDVIGTLTREAEEAGWKVNILTGDSDLAQLVTDRVTVIQTLRGVTSSRIFTPDKVCERYGIARPEYLVDYKGLVGDPSDNIPGVKGVGEKTAKKLLAQFPTIDDLYANLDKVEEKFRKKLEPGEEMAKFSRYLATIKTDLPLKLDEQSMEDFHYDLGHIDREKAGQFFLKYGFKTLFEKLKIPVPEKHDEEEQASELVLVDTSDGLAELVGKIKPAGSFTFDFETTGLDVRTSEMVGLAVTLDGKTGYYIPVGHNVSITDQHRKQLPVKDVVDAFVPLWSDPEIKKTCQNGKFEWLVCHRYGVELKGLVEDPMIADYLIDPDNRHGLKEMAMRELGRQMTTIEELIGKRGKKQLTMADVSIEKVAPYAAADAVNTYLLAEKFRPGLEKDDLAGLYDDVEMPLVSILAKMESIGIRLNPQILDDLAIDLDQKMVDISAVIFQEIGYEVNLNSPKQLAEVFFDKLQYPKIRGRSTDAEVLARLGVEHELPGMILEYRSLAKLRGTYTQNLIDLIDPHDGRIHTSYNQTVAGTGRLSSSNPNLQNIPIRTEMGRRIRKAFEANNEGEVLLSADYSQIELRLLAHFSGDPVLVKAYKNDEDIHRRTAMEVFEVSEEGVDANMRRSAKVINFGIIYGMGPDGLSKSLKQPRKVCRDFIDRFFERYPGVKAYMDGNVAYGREHGYVQTLLGRRKYFPELQIDNRVRRAAAERAAINMPLQGSAADIIKLAMVELKKNLDSMGLEEVILLQVHDELVLSIPEDRLGEIAQLAGKIMSGVAKLKIPLVVNCKAGPNWLDMEPCGDFRA